MKNKYIIFFLLIFYFFFQLSTLDYGSKINDIDYIKNHYLDEKIIKDFIEKKKIKKKSNIDTDVNWVYRYKLYSINADEVNSIMGLSKIDLKNKKFDPQVYKYGGAFIYPLGFYFYTLNKLNVLENINSKSILKNEKLIDEIYFYGRLFVLICFILSCYFLYKSLIIFSNKTNSLILSSIYLFAPGSIIYSQVMKPHWYGLLWVNLSIYFALKYIKQNPKNYYLLYLSIFLGLAIGSNLAFLPFYIFLIFSLFFLDKENSLNFRKLSYLVLSSFLVFILTNPYILINFSNFFFEANNEYLWVLKGFNFKNTLLFLNTSYIQGFGVLLSLITIFYSISEFKKKRTHNKKIIFGAYLLFFFGAAVGSYALWHIQFRYIPYILPISIIFLSYKLKNEKKNLLICVLIITILQTLPLKIAYFDENNKFSTRLNSAKWINDEIVNQKKTLCKTDPSPYYYPPIDFKNAIIKKECEFEVLVLREPKKIKNYENIVKKFEPRFQFSQIPLVYSHINPLIIIFKTTNN